MLIFVLDSVGFIVWVLPFQLLKSFPFFPLADDLYCTYGSLVPHSALHESNARHV
jgi:hypothetical protein